MTALNSHTYLDTLAQLTPHTLSDSYEGKNSTLYKRARAKFITNSLILNLVEVKESKLIKSYWNSYHCATVLEQVGQEITSKYCNNRWCLVCNRIRTAKLIKSYYPTLKTLENPYFVTLTIPNVKDTLLSDKIIVMYNAFRTIQKRLNKHKIKLLGIRKFECTYNPDRDDFHPHYHFLISGENEAKILIDKWLEFFPECDAQAQDMRKANDNSVMELFKYFTKIFPSKKGNRKAIKISALNTIFEAMQNKRVFQSLGIKAIKEVDNEEVTNLEAQIYQEVENELVTWIWKQKDWLDLQELHNSGEIVSLTGYEPSEGILKLLQNIER